MRLTPAQHDQGSQIAPHFDCLVLKKNGAIESAIYHHVTLETMASHNQKHHIAPHFNCLP